MQLFILQGPSGDGGLPGRDGVAVSVFGRAYFVISFDLISRHSTDMDMLCSLLYTFLSIILSKTSHHENCFQGQPGADGKDGPTGSQVRHHKQS